MRNPEQVLAVITSRFRVSLPSGDPVPSPKAMITLRPENEVNLQLTPRQSKQRKPGNALIRTQYEAKISKRKVPVL